MIDASPTASVSARWREAVREAVVLSLVALALAFFYNGLSGKGIFGASKPSPVAQTPGAAPEIIPIEVAASLHTGGGAQFIDSRHAYDFRLGHIPGAINLPLKDVDAAVAGLRIPKDRPLVVYCDGAECNSSLEVGSKLSIAGYAKVYVFFAGWTAWKGAGHPVVEGDR